MIRKLINRFKRNKEIDLYHAGRDYMSKLLEKYPESLAYDQAWKEPRDYSNPFDRGVLDYIDYYKDLQRGKWL